MIKDEIFDLTVCVQEATDPFYIDAKRKGIEYKVTSHPGLPRFVHGDGRRIRQVISNITANAIAHTDSGFVHVDLFVSDIRDGQAVIDIAVADSGAGMSHNNSTPCSVTWSRSAMKRLSLGTRGTKRTNLMTREHSASDSLLSPES